MLNLIKDIIAPKKCYSCKKEWSFLCTDCASKVIKFEPICYVCKRKNKNFFIHKKCRTWVYFDQIIITSHYSNRIVSKLIKNAKFYWKKDILYDIWSFLWKTLEDNYIFGKNDVMISIPMNFLKKLWRWYNQSDILARCISKKYNIFYKKNILKKIKKTGQQSQLNKLQRQENLKDCFAVNDKFVKFIKNKNIIIVDDVVSTWTTLNEVSKLLKKHGVNQVTWVCFASD